MGPRGDGAFPPPLFLGSVPGERERGTEEQPQGTQEAAGSHRPSTGARAGARLGEGSRVHLSTQTRLVLTLPHFATFWHPPPHGSQPRLPRSLRAGHTLLVSTSLCPLLPDPLPSSAAPSCSPRSPEVQTPRLWVPLGSLLHPGSLWSPPQASLPQFPASSVPGGSHGVWFLARRGAKWSQVEVGVEEKDRRPENHMLPKKTGTQDPRMQENKEQRELLSLGRERWGAGEGGRACVGGVLSPFSTTCQSYLSPHPTPAKSPNDVRSQYSLQKPCRSYHPVAPLN